MQKQDIAKFGLLGLLGYDNQPLVLQISDIKEKAGGRIVICNVNDRFQSVKVLIMHDLDEQKKLEDYDIVQIAKENVNRIPSGDQTFYIKIDKVKFVRNETRLLKSKKKAVLVQKPVMDDNRSISKQVRQVEIEYILLRGDQLVPKTWKVSGKILHKSAIKSSDKSKISYFDCILVNTLGQKVSLIFFNDLQRFYNMIQNNSCYTIQNAAILLDKYQKVNKIKVLKETTFTKTEENIVNWSESKPYHYQIADRDLRIVPSFKKYFSKIAYCLYQQSHSEYQRRPIVLHICDQFNNVYNLNIWKDHNVTIPKVNSFMLFLNIWNKGNLNTDIFHTTKQTKILSESEAQEKYNIVLSTFIPSEVIFYRKIYDESAEWTKLADIGKKEGYYFVVVTLLFEVNEIKLLMKCQSCSHILTIGRGCSCNKPNLRKYYNVRVIVCDDTGSMSVTFYSGLVKKICKIAEDEDQKQSQTKIKTRMMDLNFKTQLIKIQLKEGRDNIGKPPKWYINVVDIFKRNVQREIEILQQKLKIPQL